MTPLIEGVVEGVYKAMRDTMPGVLNQIEIAIADDIHLDPPKLFLDWRAQPGEFSEWPCVCVAAGQTTATADAGSWMDAAHTGAVIVYLQEADPRTMAFKLLRYQRAVIVSLIRNRVGVVDSDGQAAWAGINFSGTEPGRRFKIEDRTDVFGDYTVVYFRATRVEDL